MTEYVSDDLRQKIIDIICEWSKQVEEGTEPDKYLDSATIYERLKSQALEVPDRAISSVLLDLAKDETQSGKRITLSITPGDATDDEIRKYGGRMTIHDASSKLCQ